MEREKQDGLYEALATYAGRIVYAVFLYNEPSLIFGALRELTARPAEPTEVGHIVPPRWVARAEALEQMLAATTRRHLAAMHDGTISESLLIAYVQRDGLHLLRQRQVPGDESSDRLGADRDARRELLAASTARNQVLSEIFRLLAWRGYPMQLVSQVVDIGQYERDWDRLARSAGWEARAVAEQQLLEDWTHQLSNSLREGTITFTALSQVVERLVDPPPPPQTHATRSLPNPRFDVEYARPPGPRFMEPREAKAGVTASMSPASTGSASAERSQSPGVEGPASDLRLPLLRRLWARVHGNRR